MFKAFISTLSLCIVFVLNSCQADQVKWSLSDDSYFQPHQHQGKYIFINYWAVWCTPCLKEMPELAAFNQDNTDKIQVLAVNYDKVDKQTMIEQAKQFSIDLPMLLEDPAPHHQWPAQQVLPYTLIVDSNLMLVDTLIGPQTLESLNHWLAENQ